ncbi:hypothetical protein KFE25_003274 [Diacronema lutheri]|uniref:Uncharacterized protein n=1 Tax=Diacronema lutheri TaxID=2081491 RepID=A0A8J6CAL5_DIALT|nr:hypothetical protein KFE25_003274 [Diacronema lutheri]
MTSPGRQMTSLRALREELKGLLAATEDAGAKLAELDARARPYTLNPNGSLSFAGRAPRVGSDVSCALDRPGHGWLPSERRYGARGGAGGGAHSAPSLPSLSSRGSALAAAASSSSHVLPVRMGGSAGSAEHAPPYGSAPTNRWEAMQLAEALDGRLRAAGSSFDARLAAMEEAFDELTRQVGVHCAERGDVLRRVRVFYSGYAGAFGSLTRKRQADAGLANLDAQLEALGSSQRRLSARAAKAEAQLKAFDEAFAKMSGPHSARLLALAAAADGGIELGAEDVALGALSKRMAAATTHMRADTLRTILAELNSAQRASCVCALIGTMEQDEQVGTLQAVVGELLPAARFKAISALVAPLATTEQLDVIGGIAQTFSTPDLVALLGLPLARLPKERTLEVMEVLLQMSPNIAAVFARIYGRMTEKQQLRLLSLICAQIGTAELHLLKAELKLESAHILHTTEAELAHTHAALVNAHRAGLQGAAARPSGPSVECAAAG